MTDTISTMGLGEVWTLDRLQSRIDVFHTLLYKWDTLAEPLKELTKAAVLTPLVIDGGELHVWLTKRSEAVRNDKVSQLFRTSTDYYRT